MKSLEDEISKQQRDIGNLESQLKLSQKCLGVCTKRLVGGREHILRHRGWDGLQFDMVSEGEGEGGAAAADG